MRIIKPYGRSIVEADSLNERKIHRTNTAEGTAENIAALMAEPELVLAQWIGMLDKIIQKPGKDKKTDTGNPKKDQRVKENNAKNARSLELRKILGTAIWDRLTDKSAPLIHFTDDKQAEKFKTIWSSKLKTENEKTKYRPDYPQGRFYKIFFSGAGDETVSLEDMKTYAPTIVKRIYHHFYTRVLSVNAGGKLQERDKGKGLSAHRAAAAAQSTLKRHDENRAAAAQPDFSAEAYLIARQKYMSVPQRIKDKILASIGNPAAPSAYIVAIEELRAVWRGMFGASVKTFADAEKADPKMLALHQAVKDAYKRLLKGHPLFPEAMQKKLPQGKGAKEEKNRLIREKLEKLLPADMKALLRLIQATSGNRDINHLIRLGRIIHYQAAENANKAEKLNPSALLDDNAAALKFFPTAEEVAASRFWTSAGQTEIKQNEALVRSWRRALAFAARTLKDWADPNNQIDGDILLAGARKEAFEKFEEKGNKQKYATLFSNFLPEELKEAEFLYYLLDSCFEVRNAAFHFKGMKTFCNKLQEELSEKAKTESKKKFEERMDRGRRASAYAAALYAQAQNQLYVSLRNDLQALRVQNYLTENQLHLLWAELTAAEASALPLPRFRRVLQRAENAWKGAETTGLPVYLSTQNRGKEVCAAENCQYAILKLLYDKPFKVWLDKRSTYELNTWIDKSVRRSTAAAQNLNGKDKSDDERALIEARAAHLPKLAEGEKLEKFFFNLTAATAAEMRVQNGYQSNGAAAKKQAEYIEDLKCDVVAHAFAAYLRAKTAAGGNLTFTVRIHEQKANVNSGFSFDSLKPGAPKPSEKWQEKLYLLLHLIPVQEVSSLRQQIRKWEICIGKEKAEAHEASPKQLLQVMDMYIALHDAQFTGDNIQSLAKSEAEQFFVDSAQKDAERIFCSSNKVNPAGNMAASLPIRELRELRRFGDAALRSLYDDKHKVSHETVEAWLAAEKTIADKQQRLIKLHEEWSKSKDKKDWQRENGRDYAKLLDQVADHRYLTAEVRLQNALRIHRLMMSVLARLIDFSGLFERDLYFTLLALLHQENIREETAIAEKIGDKSAENLANGEIVTAVQGLTDGALKQAINKLFSITNNQKTQKEFESEGMEPKAAKKASYAYCFEHDPTIGIRNRFAHLAMLEAENLPVDLTREVNYARRLMAYDRKLKNAVSKAVIDLLEREGLLLEWDCEKHQLQNAVVSVKQAEHLGGAKILPKRNKQGKPILLPITEDLHGKAHVQMAASLFDGRAK